jgi:hypothetical protein
LLSPRASEASPLVAQNTLSTDASWSLSRRPVAWISSCSSVEPEAT